MCFLIMRLSIVGEAVAHAMYKRKYARLLKRQKKNEAAIREMRSRHSALGMRGEE